MRPFLSDIEKQWIVYQLLAALEQMSFYGLFHGDIKTENVMVTSLGWIYLTDFACYKPTRISAVRATRLCNLASLALLWDIVVMMHRLA